MYAMWHAPQICCLIILTASTPARLLICRSLAIRFLVLPPCFRSREIRLLLLDLVAFGGTNPLDMFPLFLMRTADIIPSPPSKWSVSVACSSGKFSGLLETGQCHPNSERSTVLLCRQLQTDFHRFSIV